MGLQSSKTCFPTVLATNSHAASLLFNLKIIVIKKNFVVLGSFSSFLHFCFVNKGDIRCSSSHLIQNVDLIPFRQNLGAPTSQYAQLACEEVMRGRYLREQKQLYNNNFSFSVFFSNKTEKSVCSLRSQQLFSFLGFRIKLKRNISCQLKALCYFLVGKKEGESKR